MRLVKMEHSAGGFIYINTDHVESIFQDEGNSVSIYTKDDDPYRIRGTAEEVVRLLEGGEPPIDAFVKWTQGPLPMCEDCPLGKNADCEEAGHCYIKAARVLFEAYRL